MATVIGCPVTPELHLSLKSFATSVVIRGTPDAIWQGLTDAPAHSNCHSTVTRVDGKIALDEKGTVHSFRQVTMLSHSVDSLGPALPQGPSMHAGERFNICTHLFGLVLATLGVPLLLAKTLPGGDATKIAGAMVFALSCVVLYAASTLFHGTRGRAKRQWQRMDHCAIYLLIAGSYTPFGLVALQGQARWMILAAVWGAASLGVWREFRSPVARPSLALYIGMGWVGVAAVAPLVAHIEAAGLVWLLVGAALYTSGTFFYVNPAGHRHAHGLWHLFVLGGTASHYVAVAGFLA